MKKNKYNKIYFREAWGDWFHTPTDEEIKNANRVQKALDASKANQDFDNLALSMTDTGYKGPSPAPLKLPAGYSTYGKTTVKGEEPIKFSFKRGEKMSDEDFLFGGNSAKKAADAAYKKAVSTRIGKHLSKNDLDAIDATDTTGLTPEFYKKSLPKKVDPPRTNERLNAKLVDTNNIKVDDTAKVDNAAKAAGSTQVVSVVQEGPKNAADAVRYAEASGDKATIDAAKEVQKNIDTPQATANATDAKQAVEETKEKALGPIESLWAKFKNTSFYKTIEGWITSITEFFSRKIGSTNITYGTAALWTILTAIAAYIIYKIAKYLYRKFKANKRKKLSEASKTYWYLKNHTNLSETKCCKIARYVYTR